ncbi:hypothetical protein [Stenotrophomonas sp.]|uniref:hypothetical protein n=1 Tax=Stenotrophomonas sp. TaxID=69392 RepID=UPI0028A6BDF9|nr:hypothetical protein [Stenotrophomonas sp.]
MRTTIERLDIQPVSQLQEDTTAGDMYDFQTSLRFSQMLREVLLEGWGTEDCVALKVATLDRNIRVAGAVRSQVIFDKIVEVTTRINRDKPGTVNTSAVRVDTGLEPGSD